MNPNTTSKIKAIWNSLEYDVKCVQCIERHIQNLMDNGVKVKFNR